MSRRVRIKPRFFVFTVVALAAAAGVVALILNSGGRGTLHSGTMLSEIDATAVIIRDEVCVSVEKYDRLDFSVNEGENVYEGQTVATVYQWGYTDDMLQSLIGVESEVYARQSEQLAGIENDDLSSMELQIEQKRISIRSVVMGGSGDDLLTLQKELATLLEARQTYLKASIQPTEEITALYETEATRLSQLDSYRTDVASAGNGRVSFYFDGYEQILNIDKLDTLNASLISSVAAGSSDLLGGSSSNLLYRVINPDRWYIALVTPRSEGLRLYGGATYLVEFTDAGTTKAATAMTPVVSEGGVMNMAEITEDIGSLISTRQAGVKLTAQMQGFIVPLSCVSMKDGIASITLEGDSGNYSVEVDVLAVNGDEACVVSAEASGALADGMRYVK